MDELTVEEYDKFAKDRNLDEIRKKYFNNNDFKMMKWRIDHDRFDITTHFTDDKITEAFKDPNRGSFRKIAKKLGYPCNPFLYYVKTKRPELLELDPRIKYPKEEIYDWDAFCKKFSLTALHKISRRDYVTSILQFFDIIEKDVNTYFQPPNDVWNEGMLLDFYKFIDHPDIKMPEDKYWYIKKYFVFHKVSIPEDDSLDLLRKMDMKAKKRPEIEKMIPINEDLKLLLGEIDETKAEGFAYKTAIMVLISSGLRVQKECLNLELKDLTEYKLFEGEKSPWYRVNVRKEIAKEGLGYLSFINDEGGEYLKKWLEFGRDAYIKYRDEETTTPLINTTVRNKMLFPFSYARLLDEWQRILESASAKYGKKYNEKKSYGRDAYKMRMHGIRSFVQTQFERVGASNSLVDRMIGHGPEGIRKKYDATIEETLRQEYALFMGCLYVFRPRMERQDEHLMVKELQKQIGMLQAQLTQLLEQISKKDALIEEFIRKKPIDRT